MKMRHRIFGLLLVWIALLCGCTNYVNIPAQPGDVAGHNPNRHVVRVVLSESLQAVLKKHPFEGPFAILLPETTSTKTYDFVASKTSKQAVWPGNKTRSDLPILEVKQLRIRGQDASVDIVRATTAHLESGSPNQVVTVDLKWHPLQGWLTQRIRGWRLAVDDVLRTSRDEFE